MSDTSRTDARGVVATLHSDGYWTHKMPEQDPFPHLCHHTSVEVCLASDLAAEREKSACIEMDRDHARLDAKTERERADRNQEDAERYRYLRVHPSVASETLPSSYQRFWCLAELDAEEVMDDNIRAKLAEISAQWRSAGKIGPAVSKSVSQAYELGKAEGIKEGMRRAAEIADQHASVEGIAQSIHDAILKECDK